MGRTILKNILNEVIQTQKDRCVHFHVDINYVYDNQAVAHRTTEVRYRVRD